MPAFLILLALAVWFFDMWPFYSGQFRPLMRKHDYYVHFYREDNSEEVLGIIQGVDNCRFMANEHAVLKNIKNTNWTYRCCRAVRGDRCARIEM